MEMTLLGQGYNLERNTSLASELIAAINDARYTSFQCIVAFASFGSISALTPHIHRNIERYNNIKFVVGIDQQGTSKEALEELLNWGVNAFIYHSTSRNIFHPKVYVFEGEANYLIFIGSNNFTESGLVKNIECATKISDNKNVPEDRGLLTQFEGYFNHIFDEGECVKVLTQELLDELSEKGVLPSERLRETRHERKAEADNQELRNQIPFGKANLQLNPEGFNPRRIMPARRRPNDIMAENIANDAYFQDEDNWIGNDDNSILIAEIGAGGRWKQVNFPIAMFQDFFGATAGDNSYHINLRHMKQNGDLEDIELRQAVTVRSQNYRFEIGVAEGEYPVDGRPVGVFIRVAQSNFLYRLLMPNDRDYETINRYLRQEYHGREDHLKRIIRTVNELPEDIKRLPFI